MKSIRFFLFSLGNSTLRTVLLEMEVGSYCNPNSSKDDYLPAAILLKLYNFLKQITKTRMMSSFDFDFEGFFSIVQQRALMMLFLILKKLQHYLAKLEGLQVLLNNVAGSFHTNT